MIEPLEARIAPASLTFTDVDGDNVVITTSAGALTLGGNVVVTAGQLESLDLTAAAFQDASVSIIATPDVAAGGDGRVNVGSIDASGRDLERVKVDGDLGQLLASSGTDPARGVASLSVASLGRFGTSTGASNLAVTVGGTLGLLKVKGDVFEALVFANSIGAVTVGGSLIGGGDDQSGSISARDGLGLVEIKGSIVGGGGTTSGAVTCAQDLAGVTVGGSVRGGAGFTSGVIFSADGSVGPVTIGGNLEGSSATFTGRVFGKTQIASVTVGGSLIGGAAESGQIHSDGNIGPVRIAHEIQGGSGQNSGAIRTGTIGNTGGKLASVSVGGSLIGGSFFNSGVIFSRGDMGAVKIGHDVTGGSGAHSGTISTDNFGGVNGSIAKVTIGGSLTSSSQNSGAIFAYGDIGAVKIGHDVQNGAIFGNNLPVVTIGGSLIGGNRDGSGGAIVADATLGALKIGGDIVGGSISGTESGGFSGYVLAARIASVLVGGSIISGTDTSTNDELLFSGWIVVLDDIGSLTVKGSLVGHADTGQGASPVIISARGQAFPTATSDLAIGSIKIGGSVEQAKILAGFSGFAGFNSFLIPQNANAQIGKVSIGRDWIASSLVAGVENYGANGTQGDSDDNLRFGDANDHLIGSAATPFARIASIMIKGAVAGTGGAGDHFGFSSHQIGAFKFAGFRATLTSDIDAPIELSPTTDDVTIREVA